MFSLATLLCAFPTVVAIAINSESTDAGQGRKLLQSGDCVDIQPPSGWNNPTCEDQLANTNNCEGRKLGTNDDGYCAKTCGVCDQTHTTVFNAGENCWSYCDKQSGPCDWCGYGSCCRQGWRGGEKGCAANMGGENRHECVSPASCVRIITGSSNGNQGTLEVTFNGLTVEKFWAKGDTVVDVCYTTLSIIKLRGTTDNAWKGTIEFSNDGGATYSAGDCVNCDESNGATTSTQDIVVDGNWDSSNQATTRCWGGQTCTVSSATGHTLSSIGGYSSLWGDRDTANCPASGSGTVDQCSTQHYFAIKTPNGGYLTGSPGDSSGTSVSVSSVLTECGKWKFMGYQWLGDVGLERDLAYSFSIYTSCGGTSGAMYQLLLEETNSYSVKEALSGDTAQDIRYTRVAIIDDKDHQFAVGEIGNGKSGRFNLFNCDNPVNIFFTDCEYTYTEWTYQSYLSHDESEQNGFPLFTKANTYTSFEIVQID